MIYKERIKYIEEDQEFDRFDVGSSNWAKEDGQVRSWHWNKMEPHISCVVMLLPTTYALWNSVRELMVLRRISKGFVSFVKKYFSQSKVL